MRWWVLLAIGGVVLNGGLAYAQDPNNAYIPDVQMGVYAENTDITFRDVVVTGIAEAGLWVQEPTPTSIPFSGIWCYTSSTPDVAIGDEVTINGFYEEFFDLTELNVADGGGQVIVTGTATVPTPATLLVTDLNEGSATAEDWEGVLVHVENLEVQLHLDFGEYQVSPIGDPLTLMTCDDKSLNAPARPPVSAQFNSITGIQDYSFGAYKLQPRNNDDFDWLAGEPAPGLEVAYCRSNTEVTVVFDRIVGQATAEDPLNYFFNNLGDFAATATKVAEDEVLLTVGTAFTPGSTVPEQLDVSGVENQSGAAMGLESRTFIAGVNTIDFVQTIGSGLDSSQVVGEIVTVDGIVTGDNTYDYVTDNGRNRFYIQMPAGGPWSGIFCFDRVHKVERAQEVRVAGRVLERFFKTEIDDPFYVEVLSSGNPLPAFEVVTPLTLSSGATAEPYEGCLVRVENVVVNQDTSYVSAFGNDEWTIVSSVGATDTTAVGDDGLYFYNPQVGDMLGFVQGPLDYDFEHSIEPRRWDDIDSPNGVAVGPVDAPVARTGLVGAVPNPFNPSTTLHFTVAGSAPVDLKIYDQGGRLVRTLVAGEVFEAGGHALQWDGRDDGGRQLASGVYHARFSAQGVNQSEKIALLK